MKLELEPTGERVIEDAYLDTAGAYVIFQMHAASYAFVEHYCRGRRVLDLGCGSGYGTHRIAGVAASATGVDVAPDAVAFARARYVAGNLDYKVVPQGGPLPFADGVFDVVLSFQVIEHVHDVRGYLEEARRVLTPRGVLVVITPDRSHRLLPGQKPWNRWHLREYSLDGLAGEVSPVFTIEAQLRMGAPDHVACHEMRRYRRTKWLTLPFTLPFLPESLRRMGLNALHRMQGVRAPVSADGRGVRRVDYGFGEKDFVFAMDAPNPMNLVLVARKA